MKRFFFSVLVSLTLLALTTGTVFAGSAVELVSVSNDGGGPTFVFRVSSEFSESELHGFVQVEGGDSFPLSCVKTDETTVVCHASKKVGGQNVVVGFGGARFWQHVPEPHSGASGGGTSQYCYGVYDLYEEEDREWFQYGETCMDSPAVVGDTYVMDNPWIGIPDWVYHFWEDTPNTDYGDPGEGFYPIGEGEPD